MSLPKIELANERKKSQALALGWFAQKPKKKAPEGRLPDPIYKGKSSKSIDTLASELKKSGHFAGRKKHVDTLRFYEYAGHANLLLLGLGTEERWNPEMARQAGASLLFAQKRERFDWITLDCQGLFSHVSKKQQDYYIQAFCEGYLLAGYEFHHFKTDKPRSFVPGGLRLEGASKSAEGTIKRAVGLCEAVNFARSLGDHPSNQLTPTLLGKTTQKMTKSYGIQTTIWDNARLKKENMGLILGVGRGSDEESRLLVLEYKGGKKSDPHIALVGKAVTFDSGGICLKPPSKMDEMKYDMMGAATVLGIMQAVAALKLKVNVNAYIASAENMPSGSATKPGDVMFSRSGKSVEMINTDAEGRLVMADAIEYAQEKKPQAIMDFATLTGAVLIALGTTTSGIMGNSRPLIKRLQASSEVTGERVWELPLYEEFEEFFRSPVADIRNSSDIREAGSSKGGTFLKHFVKPEVPWVHCDIAGTAWHRRDVNYHPDKYASGAMVRLVTHLLENWKPL